MSTRTEPPTDVMTCTHCIFYDPSKIKYECTAKNLSVSSASHCVDWKQTSSKNTPDVEGIPPEILEILQDPELYQRIDTELDKKIEGEHEARKAIFLTLNMRNVANLNKASDNLMINDASGTGKDHVVSNTFAILPNHEKVKRERISPKVLAYLNDVKSCPEGWVKKALYLEDLSNTVLNDDTFKVMSSADPNGLTETSVIVNNNVRNINIVGKPSIVITIANSSPKREQLRRYPICNLNGSVLQTEAVLRKQAKFAKDGLSSDYDPKIKTMLGYLKRIKVRLPFAERIAQVFPSGNVIIRTHFPRFLDYIKSSCALHQYQRKIDCDGYYIATDQDYDFALGVMVATTSNQLMIPLTKIQRDILDTLSKVERVAYTFLELENLLQHIPIQSRWLRTQIERLGEEGFLSRSNEKSEHSIRPLAAYTYNEVVKLELPTFKQLNDFETNNTSTTNKTNKTNNANKEKKPSSPNSSNLHYLHDLHSELGAEIQEELVLPTFLPCSSCGSTSEPCTYTDKSGRPLCKVCHDAKGGDNNGK